MRVLFTFALVAGLAFAMNPAQNEFVSFMKAHGKQYETADEMFARFNIFSENLAKINAHNEDTNQTFWLAVNQFADLTVEEFKAQFLTLKLDESRPKNYATAAPAKVAVSGCSPSAASCDWRTQGALNPIKDQGQCGSCWAFSTVAAVESGYYVASGKLLNLAEQQLVDCAGSYGNQGCNGGLMDYGFEYVKAKGLDAEAQYKYTAADGSCKASHFPTVLNAGTVTGYTDIKQGDENGLLAAVAAHPVSVAVDAESWQFYAGGVLKGLCGTSLDHGVLAVGWGVDGTTNYWIVRNSWGTSWGEQGYIRLARGKNECGIALAASFPTF